MSGAGARPGDGVGGPSALRVLGWAAAIGLGPTVLLLVALFLPNGEGIDRLGYLYGRDFVNFRAAAVLAGRGEAAILWDLDAYHAALRALFFDAIPFLNVSYPPSILPLLAPLGWPPYPVALAGWSLAGLAALAATVRLTLGPGAGRAIGVLLMSPLVLFLLVIGQASAFFSAVFVVGLWLAGARPILAGLLLGLLSLKPQLGVLVPFWLLARGEGRALGVAAATAVGLVALSLVLYGVEPWRGFLDQTVAYQGRVVVAMQGFYTVLMVAPYAGFRFLGLGYGAAMILHAAVAGAVLGITGLALKGRAADGLSLALLSLATLIVVPYGLLYDLVVPATALAIAAAERRGWGGRGVAIGLGLFWGAPLLALPAGLEHLPFLPALVLAAFAAVATLCLRSPRAAA